MSSFFSSIKNLIIIIIVFIIVICIFFIPTIQSTNVSIDTSNSEEIKLNPNGFIWPAPGYTKINCNFGKRVAPTTGASTFHKGVDIGAPEGTNLIAVCDGEITFTNFLGGGGYTITISVENMKISYCHVNPNYIVKEGDKVKQGQIIGKVGPKYVYGVVGNKYTDSTRKTNEWSNNRTTFALWNPYKWRIYQSIRFLLNYTNYNYNILKKLKIYIIIKKYLGM